MKESRRPFRAAELAGEQRINAERIAFAEKIAKIIAKHGKGDTFTPEQYALVQNDIKPVMDEFYGKHQGDQTARFYSAITETAAMARRIAMAQDAIETERLVKKHRKAIEDAIG